MIIEKLRIKNFGIYKDTHTLDLSVTRNRPIILIKALNGFGKTTILTAIQVILYGRLAPVVRDSKKRFNAFIMDFMNNRARGDTSLQLDISFTEDRRKNIYSVFREWRLIKNRFDINESFSVKKNGEDDKVLTERWLEFIEGLLPMNIMPLFFFDGEKVETMADLTNSASMLQTSIFSLFGMDLVSKLQDDLRAYNYKYKMAERPGLNFSLLSEYRNNLAVCNEELRKLHQEKAALVSRLGYIQNQQDKLEIKFKREGGDLYNRRSDLTQQELQLKNQLEICFEEKNVIMATEGPLLLVPSLLKAIEKQAGKEIGGEEAKIAGKYLEKQAAEILAIVNNELSGEKVDILKKYFAVKKKELLENSKVKSYLNLSHAGYARLLHLRSHILPETEKRLKELDKTIDQLKKEQNDIAELISRIPSQMQIQKLIDEIEQNSEEIEVLKVNIIKTEEAIKSAGFRLNEAAKNIKELMVKNKEDNHSLDKTERIQHHSWLVQQSLLKFKESVTQYHLDALKKQIKKCFNILLHKKNFIKQIGIDAASFQISLVKNDGEDIRPDHLSAGERQLLATAIFWALSLESGIEAPVIIDTPLGRLDSLHRRNIVQNYFPKAGKQVILLSTDEEITDELFTEIASRVSHFYTIEFEDELCSSFIRKVS